MSSNVLTVGVLLVGVNQLLDVSPVDLLGMLSTKYLKLAELPGSIQQEGLDISIRYISDVPGNHKVTADAALEVTHLIDSPECHPGKLDILMLPGSDQFRPSEEVVRFIKGHAASHGTTILTICTGTFMAAAAGVFDGKMATGPRTFYKELRQRFPQVNWVDQRWVQDGNTWSSGNITNGQDMISAFIRQRWPGILSETVLGMSDVAHRKDNYDN
ncbi:class I glutamine amidotransferase-like protein [Aspergillus pseudonomiae]|uniref:Class I glutamine amidotransferase-like protein n=1 Tax=Aspergillus pseudonomiae TaxID=1506151 RepID=A0A5N6IGX1_9EURO|nr:class I glutamine amidotransferase-like protein [Aspergillus pseudonomiae]KAB8265992.1 class I glutamine amidotransferase-like protein [Aspergillus pseudonomiae]KAE8408856.1 class I glutamine amidotransferase-like protein [Aspergillus pseudonomiae]